MSQTKAQLVDGFNINTSVPADSLAIDSSGRVGIGTSLPSNILHVSGTSSTPAVFERTGTTGAFVALKDSTSQTFIGNTNGVFSIQTPGSSYSDKLVVTSAGLVGIGTTSPAKLLHVQSGSVSGAARGGSFTKTLFESSDASNSYWEFQAASTAENDILFSKGAAGSYGIVGYDHSADALRFHANSTERARIDSDGRLLVGTSSGVGALSGVQVKTGGSTASTYGIYIENSVSGFLLAIEDGGRIYTGSSAYSPYNNTTGSAANLFVDSNGILFRSTSSLKYKKDIKDASWGLAEVMILRPVTYKTKAKDDNNRQFGGLIAEEVHDSGLSDFVQYANDGSPDALNYGNMVALCIKAIQEQHAMITELQAEVAALKTQ